MRVILAVAIAIASIAAHAADGLQMELDSRKSVSAERKMIGVIINRSGADSIVTASITSADPKAEVTLQPSSWDGKKLPSASNRMVVRNGTRAAVYLDRNGCENGEYLITLRDEDGHVKEAVFELN